MEMALLYTASFQRGLRAPSCSEVWRRALDTVGFHPKCSLRQRKKPLPWAESYPRGEPLSLRLRRYCGPLIARMAASTQAAVRACPAPARRKLGSWHIRTAGRNKEAVALVASASPMESAVKA